MNGERNMTGTGDEERAAAIGRFEAFAASLERFSVEAFRTVSLRVRDPDDRDRLAREAAAIAAAAGIGNVLERAREAAVRHVTGVYDEGMFRPTLVGLNWGLSDGPTRDRVAIVHAVQDAVAAAVLGPLAPPGLTAELTDPYDAIASGPLAPRDPWRPAPD